MRPGRRHARIASRGGPAGRHQIVWHTTDDDRPTRRGRPLQALLRRPLRVGTAALTTVAFVTLAFALVVVAVIGPRVDRANEMLSALQDGHIAMINQETGLRGFLVTREPRFLEPYWKGVTDLERADAALAALVAEEPEIEEAFAELELAEQAFIEEWAEPTLRAQPEIGDTEALSALLRQDKRLFDRVPRRRGRGPGPGRGARATLASRQRTAIVLGGALIGARRGRR